MELQASLKSLDNYPMMSSNIFLKTNFSKPKNLWSRSTFPRFHLQFLFTWEFVHFDKIWYYWTKYYLLRGAGEVIWSRTKKRLKKQRLWCDQVWPDHLLHWCPLLQSSTLTRKIIIALTNVNVCDQVFYKHPVLVQDYYQFDSRLCCMVEQLCWTHRTIKYASSWNCESLHFDPSFDQQLMKLMIGNNH